MFPGHAIIAHAQILKNKVIQSYDYLSPYHGECEHFDDTSFYAKPSLFIILLHNRRIFHDVELQ